MGKILKKAKHQTRARKSLRRDALYRALPPGKRISRSGKIYYEYRDNRSDLRPIEWSRALHKMRKKNTKKKTKKNK